MGLIFEQLTASLKGCPDVQNLSFSGNCWMA